MKICLLAVMGWSAKTEDKESPFSSFLNIDSNSTMNLNGASYILIHIKALEFLSLFG